MADLVRQLHSTLEAGSLAKLVKARKAQMETFLVVDHSASMSAHVHPNSQTRCIDALRALVTDLRQDVACPLVAFSSSVKRAERIPEPYGGTNMIAAIQFCQQEGATHLIMISDGMPQNPPRTLEVAAAFPGVIDVFYVGPDDPQDAGYLFMQELAKAGHGKAQATSLRETKQLEGRIRGLIGDGK
jgi:hypothetical protein